MATLQEFGVPGAGPGILRPLLAHHFRVMYRSSHFNSQDCLELTAQTVSVSTDFKNKQIKLRVEQPVTGEVLELMQEFVSHPVKLIVQAMDGGDGVISAMEFTQLKTVSHEFLLDYAVPSYAATHEVVLSYSHLMIKSIIKEK